MVTCRRPKRHVFISLLFILKCFSKPFIIRYLRIVLGKLHFQNVFSPHENDKRSFSNSSGLKGVSEKFRFRDSLVGTVCKKEAVFSDFSGVVWTGRNRIVWYRPRLTGIFRWQENNLCQIFNS